MSPEEFMALGVIALLLLLLAWHTDRLRDQLDRQAAQIEQQSQINDELAECIDILMRDAKASVRLNELRSRLRGLR